MPARPVAASTPPPALGTAVVWLILALPGLGVAHDLVTSENPRILHVLVHPTGEFAARFMILAMMATPLRMLLPGWRGPRWLVRHRRHLGVAAFCYAAAHLGFYLLDKADAARVIAELPRLYVWTGWLAFAVFLPLAATSNDWAVRRLGTRWKPLQRWTYAAAALTFVHWASLHDWRSWEVAAIHFAPLALLTLFRLGRTLRRPAPA